MLPSNSILIACSMLEFELQLLLRKQQPDLPVIWMERGLHEQPDKLRAALQEQIHQQQDKDYILLAFGLCGNSTLGLNSPQARLVIPKFDDCIRMYMTLEPGIPPAIKPDCIYFTNGWLEHDEFSLLKLEYYLAHYGEKKGRRIIDALYKNYTGVNMIELPSYNLADCAERVAKFAALVDLKIDHCPGTLRVLDKLLSGSWDQEFCFLEPGETVTAQHFDGRAIG